MSKLAVPDVLWLLLASTNHDRNHPVYQVGEEGNNGQGKGRDVKSARCTAPLSTAEAGIAVQHGNRNHSSEETQVDNGAKQGEERDTGEAARQEHSDAAVSERDSGDANNG